VKYRVSVATESLPRLDLQILASSGLILQ